MPDLIIRHMLTEDTGEVVDHILGPFMFDRIGKNDMAVINGLVVATAVLVVAHCERTGDDIEETADMFRDSFNRVLQIVTERS